MSQSQQTSSEFLFELDAGRVCLDFANTRDSSGDHLTSYPDLLAFALQAHLITPEDAAWLRAEAGRDQHGADGVLLRARWLRTAIRAIFSRLAAGEGPRELDLQMLNKDLAESLGHARVVPAGGDNEFRWGWSPARDMEAPIWPISRSAADLLTSTEERRLVRQCSGTECEWLFLDTSRNRSRQWCSMQSCGNREKARRHYQRMRQRREASPADDAPRGRGRGRRTPAAPADDASATVA